MNLLPLYAVNFIGALGFSIVIPYLVFWLAEFGGGPSLYGVLGATYAASQFVGAPILGRASDRFGRKKILFLSQFGTLLSWVVVLMALVSPKTILFVTPVEILGTSEWTLPLIILFTARFFDGFTGGNISVANAYLADVSSDEERGKNYGRMSASANLGFVMGPSLAGLMSQDKYVVLLAISISFVGLLLITFFLPNEKKLNLEGECNENVKNESLIGKEARDCYDEASHSMGEVLTIKGLPVMLLLYFIYFLGFNLFYSSFPLQAQQVLSWSEKELGLFFSFLSALMIAVQGPIFSFLSQKISESWLMKTGSLLLSLSMLSLTFNGYAAWLTAVLFALGNGLLWPSFLSKLSKLGGKKEQGSIQGYGSSLGSLASLIALPVGAVMFTQFGSVVFVGSALVFFLGLLLLVFKTIY